MVESVRSWLPLLVLVIFLVSLVVYSIKQKRQADLVQSINEEMLRNSREFLSLLRDIKELLKDR